ncbi:MAG: non-canonical purine NTP pyrophosphatase [bacterium]|nr:non-canonical purine NTP pyrophosphatase [bacterium]
MQKLLIATKNVGKAHEVGGFFERVGIKTQSLIDFPDIKAIEETGSTFEENAILKAKSYFALCNMPCVADDGGLEIDALGGEPGVKSRRWIGREMTDWEMVDYALLRLKGVPPDMRTARLRAVIAFYDGDVCLTETDALEGVLLRERPRDMDPGLPFRGLLFIPQFNKLYKDLTHEEHEAVNHRRKMLTRMLPKIQARLA